MMAGEWVSGYSKWSARPSIPRLGPTGAHNLSSRRCSQTNMEPQWGNRKRWYPRRGQGHWKAQKSSDGSPDEGRGVAGSTRKTEGVNPAARQDGDNNNPP